MRLFGTNGVRGLVGTTMTPTLALELGLSVGTWLRAGARVAVGRDARGSGPMLQAAFSAGLQATGVHVTDVGVCPSPGIQIYVRDRGFDAGAIVTASHNPPEWNGIKLVAPDGTETERPDEEAVEALMASRNWRVASWDGVGSADRDDGAPQHYVDAVLSRVDRAAIQAAGLKVVVDAGGGAACETTPMLLSALGVEAVRLSCTFDGAFSDRPSEPTPDNARACMKAVVDHGADLGVLHDGDADRAVFITADGGYVWGDTALALAALHELPRHKRRVMVTGVSSSTCVADAARAAGGTVEWTPVGSPIVARRMIDAGAPFGGEDNGGFMFARHQVCRDGLMAVAFLLELVATTKRPLADLLGDIPRYALEKRKVAVEDAQKAPLVAALKAGAADLEGATSIDLQDGVKATYADGWFLVRPSGTEAIFRIQAEGADADAAAALADRAQAWLEDLLQTAAAS